MKLAFGLKIFGLGGYANAPLILFLLLSYIQNLGESRCFYFSIDSDFRPLLIFCPLAWLSVDTNF